MEKRGALITIEGTDGSGKQTQAKLLLERLTREGTPCEMMSFPRYETPTGRIISQCYLGKKRAPEDGDVAWFGDADSVDPLLASLYYAADRYASAPEMRKILDSGTNLILDRYFQSNLAHQGGKIKDRDERREFFVSIGDIELRGLKIPDTDKTIFLYMPWEVSLELRKGRDSADGHESNIEHLKRAEEVYLDLSESNTWERIDCAPDRTLSSLLSPEKIHEEVYAAAMRAINWKLGIGDFYLSK